jgi:hypothetical protein
MSLYGYLKVAPCSGTDPTGLLTAYADDGIEYPPQHCPKCCCLVIVLQYDPQSGLGMGKGAEAGNSDFKASASALMASDDFKKHCSKFEKIEVEDVSGPGENSGFGGMAKLIAAATGPGKQCADGIKHIIVIGHGIAAGIAWPNRQSGDDNVADSEYTVTTAPDPARFPLKKPPGKRSPEAPPPPASLEEAINEGPKGHLSQIDLETCHSAEQAVIKLRSITPPGTRVGGIKGDAVFRTTNPPAAIPPQPDTERGASRSGYNK